MIGSETTTWSALKKRAAGRFARRMLPDRPVVLTARSQREALEFVAFLAGSKADFLLMPAESFRGTLRDSLFRQGFGRAGSAVRPARFIPGRVSLLTSGSTGLPKRVDHTWKTLLTLDPSSSKKPQTWLLPYRIGSYAWYQLVTLSLFARGHSLVALDDPDPESVTKAILRHSVTAVSSTPTFWRLLLLRTPRATLKRFRLRQITLGGERVDPAILNALHALYPRARVSHIYASSEAGACIVVHDRREGFPAAWLADKTRKVKLRIRNAQLQIRSPYASTGGRGRWQTSGDFVEVRGDRVLFVGRTAGGLINVGGNKVFAADVEKVLLLHPSVAWCRVSGQQAPLVGALPKAEVLLRPGKPVKESRLVRHCKTRLPEYAVPRIWEFVKRLPMAASLKTEEPL